MKEILIKFAIPLLVIAVLFVFLLATIFSILVAVGLYTGSSSIHIAEAIPLLSTIAISSGVLIAILTFARDRERIAVEREENRSKILLEQAKAGLDDAYDLLKDRNNDRLIWIRASRVLLEAVALGKEIKAPAILKAYRLYADKIRNQLYRALSMYDTENRNYRALPPQFYYGIKDWKDKIGVDLDKVALEAAPKASGGWVTISENIDVEPILRLDIKSVVAIFNFLEIPNDYADPLKTVNTWMESWEKFHGMSQGARRYVAHASTTIVAGGKIHNKDSAG